MTILLTTESRTRKLKSMRKLNKTKNFKVVLLNQKSHPKAKIKKEQIRFMRTSIITKKIITHSRKRRKRISLSIAVSNLK